MLKLAALLLVSAYASAVNYYDRPFEVRQRMMGTFLDGQSFSQGYEVRRHSEEEQEALLASMPTSFDARTKWPQCSSVIGFIKDQAACGSCWAVAASETIADRQCISCKDGTGNPGSSNGLVNPPNENVPEEDVSAEQIMACCNYCGNGCQGGYPIDAMRYYCETGVVSGGWFGSKCGCQAYKVNPTVHTEGPTPACSSSCDDPSYPLSFNADKRFCSKYYGVQSEATMMQEIMTNGPIECGFTVKQPFEDFFRNPANAKKVYSKNQESWWSRTLGGHAIKIIGWGVDSSSGMKYWLINNSWNVTWADQGQFRFQRGVNLDGMESQCVAATPKCSSSRPKNARFLQCKGRDF